MAFAQNWAPIGAKRTYSQYTINPNYITYTTYESIGDTIVDNQNCKILTKVKRYQGMADTSFFYMYSNNEKVYFHQDTSWCLLYDFIAQPGDSFQLDCYGTSSQPFVVKILSVDTVVINGQQKKLYDYAAGNIVVVFAGHVIEDIGNVSSMFPIYDNEDAAAPLRCYEDQTLGLYKNQYYYNQPWEMDCDAIITGISPIPENKSLKVYPNPTSGFLNLEIGNSNNRVELYDLFGSRIMAFECGPSYSIDVSHLPTGVYLLKINNDLGGISYKVFKR